MKTNKSYTSRLKLTKTGKLMAKAPGFNHYNAKQSRTKQLAGRKPKAFSLTNKNKSKMMPFA